MKLIMYVRKSSEAEDKQAMSIPAQEHQLREVAQRQGHTIVGHVVAESMSAKRPGRPLFATVLERVNRREAEGILCWHLDRLARNPIDGASIMWNLSEGTIKSIVTPDRTYTGTGDDKLMMSIIFGMATKYSDDLSRNVRRGYAELAQRGIWPCAAVPIGYVRDLATKMCIPDPDRWSKVQQLWRRRIAGETIARLVESARNELVLTTRKPRPRQDGSQGRLGGRLVARNYVYTTLNNPFYAGLILWNETTHQGLHKPMISPAEYYGTQVKGHRKNRTRLDLPYRGLIACGDCGGTVIAERHIKPSGRQFIYYRCIGTTRSPRKCFAQPVPERSIVEALRNSIADVSVSRTISSIIIDALTDRTLGSPSSRNTIQRRQASKLHEIRDRQSRLLQAFLAGLVSEEVASVERKRLQVLEAQAAATVDEQQEPSRVLELLKTSILANKDALLHFDGGDSNKKSAIAGALCSNLTIKDRIIAVTLKEPFKTLAEFSRKYHRVTRVGFEPTTISLKGCCSTN